MSVPSVDDLLEKVEAARAVALLFSSQSFSLGAGRPWMSGVAGGSLMAWVRQTAVTGSESIVGFTGGTGSTRAKLSIEPPGNATIRARALDGDAGGNVASATALAAGVWIHIAAVLDFSQALAFIYINGALNKTGTVPGMTKGNTSATNSTAGSVASTEGGGANFFPGLLEDVRIYNRALGPAEISTIYAGLGSDAILTGIQARWLCQDLSPGTVAANPISDLSSNRFGGVPVGSPTYQPGIARPKRVTRVQPILL